MIKNVRLKGNGWVMTGVDIDTREELANIISGYGRSMKCVADYFREFPFNILPGNLMNGEVAYIVPSHKLICVNAWVNLDNAVISIIHEMAHYMEDHQGRYALMKAGMRASDLLELKTTDELYQYVLRNGEKPLSDGDIGKKVKTAKVLEVR